jgi:hypothetical protein
MSVIWSWTCFYNLHWNNYLYFPRYFSFRLPHLNIPTGPPQTNWRRINSERGLLKISVIETDTATSGLQMSVIWSWTCFYNLHWNNYLYFKGLLYIWEEMIMVALLHMAGLENSEWSVSMTEIFTKPRSLFILVQFVWGGPRWYI